VISQITTTCPLDALLQPETSMFGSTGENARAAELSAIYSSERTLTYRHDHCADWNRILSVTNSSHSFPSTSLASFPRLVSELTGCVAFHIRRPLYSVPVATFFPSHEKATLLTVLVFPPLTSCALPKRGTCYQHPTSCRTYN
jgi:hypothetical protein